MVIFKWPVFGGDGRADRTEKHLWTQLVNAPLDPKRWLYICGPNSAAQQVLAVAGTACAAQPVAAPYDDDYSHCFEFPHGGPVEVEQLLAVLERIRTLAPRAHVDHAFVLDWYKVPEDDVPSTQWANTNAGELVNRGKYRGHEGAVGTVADLLAHVVQMHPLLRSATLVTVPGSRGDGRSFGERLAAEIQAKTGNPLVATVAPGGHVPRKGEGSATSLVGTLSLSQTIAGPALVIDDVVKSGDSISAAALAAREAGASNVYALAAVKTLSGW